MAWEKRADMVVHEVEPFNAEPPRSALTGALTDSSSFYVRNHGPVPETGPGRSRVTVSGLVDHPLELDLDQLRDRFEQHDVIATLQCAGNRRAGLTAVRDIPGEIPWGPGATSTARWTGVRLADVVQAAGPAPEAEHVAFEAPDVSGIADPPQRFGGSIPIGKARSPEVLLAWAMNGDPLPAVHGAPVRVVVPGYIGARSVKWLEHIVVRERPSDNFFQATAYRLLPPEADPGAAGPGDGISLGPVALNCDVTAPDDGAPLTAGAVTVRGHAFAGGTRRVARVDVSPDGGRAWTRARLDDPAGPWTWTLWHAVVDLPAGPGEIVARAWDDTAALQPESAAALWNPKGYVNNSWGRVRVTAEPPGQAG